METKSVVPETIISGFTHLTWLIMLIILVSGVDIAKFISFLMDISAGPAVLLAAMVFGLSHFLGTLANRLLASLLSIFSNAQDISTMTKARGNKKELANELDMNWLAKNYFLSMSFAGLFLIILTLCLDCKFDSGNQCGTILVIGLPLEVATIVAFLTQRKRHLQIFKKIITDQSGA